MIARRLLLWDVDGTLVDTRGSGRAALAGAMEAVYGETGPIQDFDFHGKTDPAIVRGLLRLAGFPDAEIQDRFPELWERYVPILESELARRDGKVRLYPGVRGLLDRLEGEGGWVNALVTGNVAAGAWRKLAAAGIDHRFTFGAFGSDSERREELPPLAMRRAARLLGTEFAAGDVVVVGDTPEDVRCARHSRLRAVAVATGRHTAEELRAHGPDQVLTDLSDTEAVLEALGP